jgi:predicted nucleic acid-binding protein
MRWAILGSNSILDVLWGDLDQSHLKRITDRDPDDWPTVALALKLDLPVWTQDKDHTDAGIEVFTTGDLLDALRDAGHDPDLA